MEASETLAATVGAQARELEQALEAVTQHVYRYARFRMMNTQDAEDATMETIHALRKRPGPFLSADNPIHFAIGVCRRKIANIARAARITRLFKKPEPDWTFRSDTHVAVGQTLERLSPEHREVLALKYFHEFSIDEISALMGRSPAAVNSLLQRARQAFVEKAPSREVFGC
jgi:RNA polymerase sigma-70 factor (ECF subfamily)